MAAMLRVLCAAIALALVLPGLASAKAKTAARETSAADGEAVEGLGSVEAITLGLIEGVTEYLPVSSTGHLAVAQQAMDIGQAPEEKEAADSYAIAIQFGTI